MEIIFFKIYNSYYICCNTAMILAVALSPSISQNRETRRVGKTVLRVMSLEDCVAASSQSFGKAWRSKNSASSVSAPSCALAVGWPVHVQVLESQRSVTRNSSLPPNCTPGLPHPTTPPEPHRPRSLGWNATNLFLLRKSYKLRGII